MTDDLSRLRAGLDRDEAIARAAAEHDTAGTGDGTWFAGEADHHGIGLCASEQQAARIDYYPTVDTEHITLHDPSRVLRQVEVYRKLMADYEWCKTANDAHRSQGFPVPEEDEATESAYETVLSALASIYPEDTTETGTQP